MSDISTMRDPFTGLLTRQAFERQASRLCREMPGAHVLILFDIDNFKLINTATGLSIGDRVLHCVSERIDEEIRKRLPNSLVARVGDDEFTAFLAGDIIDSAFECAQHIRSLFAGPTVLDGTYIDVKLSIGVVRVESGEPFQESMIRADVACQRAKRDGGNRVFICRERGEVLPLSELRERIEGGYIVLMAQRIGALQSRYEDRNRDHYEILTRLLTAEGEVITPDRFIPFAEQFGIMSLYDRNVIEATLERVWQAAESCGLTDEGVCDHFRFNINLSAQSVSEVGLAEWIASRLDHYGLPGEVFCFEITETKAITNFTAVHALIDQLRQRGCRFAIDDFGYGYSSYAYLNEFGEVIDYLKIDGALVQGIGKNSYSLAMVHSIAQVGRIMNIKTVAEYVDSREIMHELREIGIDYAQGFELDRPKTLDTVIHECLHGADMGSAVVPFRKEELPAG